MDAVQLAADIIKESTNRGCDKAEVFIKSATRLSVEAKEGAVEALESSRDFGIALKVIIKKQKLGFSFTTDPKDIKDLVSRALNGANWTTEDKYVDIPVCIPASKALVLDERIRSIKEDDIIKKAIFLEKAVLDSDKKIKKVRKAEISLGIKNTTILNSNGIDLSYESTYISSGVTALASDGQDNQMGWDFATSRRLNDIDLVSIAKGASKRAIDLLGARKISAVKTPVVLDHSVASSFLRIFSASLSAEAVQKNRSFLAGKVGEKIISPAVNIIDDGLMPWKPGTKPVDDEGVPTSKKEIVSAGKLSGFLHNSYTAKRQGISSTGNAVRANFKSLPGISVTNLYIDTAGGRDENRLISSLSRGILVLDAMGVHTADPVSGDFSVGISGLWIEGGEPAYPIKEAVMSGNILELFKKVEDVGDSLKFYGNTGSPCLLIGEMDISA